MGRDVREFAFSAFDDPNLESTSAVGLKKEVTGSDGKKRFTRSRLSFAVQVVQLTLTTPIRTTLRARTPGSRQRSCGMGGRREGQTAHFSEALPQRVSYVGCLSGVVVVVAAA